MKKRILSVLLAALMLAAPTVLPASAADQVLGQYLYTDIVAYIDNHPIRSYNILGNTYIVVEDLMQYGFDVTWDGVNGRLVIGTTRTAAPEAYTSTYKPTANTVPAGTPAGDYYYTQVTTWIGDKQITGYNIGGYTCIFMDDLAAHFAAPGGYVWSPEDKALYMASPALVKEPVVEFNAATDAVEAYIKADAAAIRAKSFDAEQLVHLADFESLYGADLRAAYIDLLVELNETISYKITGSKITGSTAEVTVDISCRDLTFALSEFYVKWMNELAGLSAQGKTLSEGDTLELSMKLALEAFGDDTLPVVNHERVAYLNLVNGVWTLDTEKSEGFINSLVGGMVDGSLFGRQ
ncbi:MAG: hypothetical protein IJX53_01870 [Clostridia bacterium]|nr:hypothetical protein [Clostridia bacterium]